MTTTEVKLKTADFLDEVADQSLICPWVQGAPTTFDDEGMQEYAKENRLYARQLSKEEREQFLVGMCLWEAFARAAKNHTDLAIDAPYFMAPWVVCERGLKEETWPPEIVHARKILLGYGMSAEWFDSDISANEAKELPDTLRGFAKSLREEALTDEG